MAQAQDTGLLIRFAERAHIGRRKKEQQDFHGHLSLPADPGLNRPAIYLFAVADGVSMGTAGALASQTAVETALGRFGQLVEEGTTDLVTALNKAFSAAADEVARLAEDRPGMATTFAAALLVGDRLVTAHVGDSRVYLARPTTKPEPTFKVIGVDHSWVEEVGRVMVQNGDLVEQDLLTDPRRHTITRALGMAGEVLADYNTEQLQPGDLILLCSDGLWDLLEPSLLEDFMLSAASDLEQLKDDKAQSRLQALAQRLEEAALAASGRDNITLSLIQIERTGKALALPALPRLLAQTAQEVEARTSLFDTSQTFNPTIEDLPEPVSYRAYQPMTGGSRPESEQLNFDATFSKAQKLFALGHWDEALDEFLQIEKAEPSYRQLYEVLGNVLLRYVEGAMNRDQTERVASLFKRLSDAGVIRYNETLADYCLEESRKASQQREYVLAKALAEFVLQLRPGDGRARVLQELCDLYLELNQPDLALGDRLAIAQKIYARDADFGAIQDDLAIIYMELGDEAVLAHQDNDALSWYQMIRPLRPGDTRLVSLATNKQRAIQDTLARRESQQTNRAEVITKPLADRPSPNVLNQRNERSNPPSPDFERVEGKPENDVINRLRERVSRAQKAWDAGRKEVGAEYIYLVEQLSAVISPNPWQPTFPRVCYDYGKWLLDQKQYGEARPYFQKAQNLGMPAAQQRISEIDRLMREQAAGPRGASPVDLPEPETRSWQTNRLGRNADSNEKPTIPFTTKLTPSPLVPEVQVPPSRQPLIQRRIDAPEDAKFVGTSHAGDGVLGPERSPGTEEAERPPAPLSAAALAAGNTSSAAEDTGNWDRFEKPERMVGMSGTLRQRDLGNDPLQSAASRELNRLQNQGLSQADARPEVVRRRRTEGFMSLVGGLTPLATIVMVGVVLVIGAILLITIFNNGKPSTQNDQSGITAAVPTVVSATGTSPLPTVSATTVQSGGPAIITARLEGIAPSDVRVFLAAPNDTPANYREREFTLDAGVLQLPQAIVNKLDPTQKYTVIARPKDTPTRKYQADLPLDAPLQGLWSKGDLSLSPSAGLDVTLKIPAEAANFYPTDGGDQDADLPGGGRYIKATRHNIKPEFYKYYNDNGGLGRLGYPISEEFDWKDVGLVQFFERGWLVRGANDSLVRLGKLGQTVLDEPSFDSALKPAPGVGTAAYKVDQAFTAVANDNRYGKPLSAAFEISSGNTKKRVQYFELARLEVDPSQKTNPTINLGLLGTEYARARNWTR